MTPEQTEARRKLFEEKVFADYYVRGIKRNPDADKGMSVEFVPGNHLAKSELCERNGERYARAEIDMMWHGFKLALDAMPQWDLSTAK
jgi:hypothetical protein